MSTRMLHEGDCVIYPDLRKGRIRIKGVDYNLVWHRSGKSDEGIAYIQFTARERAETAPPPDPPPARKGNRVERVMARGDIGKYRVPRR